MAGFLDVPNEILAEIASYLTPKDLASLTCTCKTLIVACQPLLYATFTLNSTRLDAANTFIESVDRHEVLHQAFKKLSIKKYHLKGHYEHADRKYGKAYKDKVTRLLTLAQQLRELDITIVELSFGSARIPPIKQFETFFASAQTLSRLHLSIVLGENKYTSVKGLIAAAMSISSLVSLDLQILDPCNRNLEDLFQLSPDLHSSIQYLTFVSSWVTTEIIKSMTQLLPQLHGLSFELISGRNSKEKQSLSLDDIIQCLTPQRDVIRKLNFGRIISRRLARERSDDLRVNLSNFVSLSDVTIPMSAIRHIFRTTPLWGDQTTEQTSPLAKLFPTSVRRVRLQACQVADVCDLAESAHIGIFAKGLPFSDLRFCLDHELDRSNILITEECPWTECDSPFKCMGRHAVCTNKSQGSNLEPADETHCVRSGMYENIACETGQDLAKRLIDAFAEEGVEVTIETGKCLPNTVYAFSSHSVGDWSDDDEVGWTTEQEYL